MATLPQRVLPGDLITSELMNAWLGKLNDFESRLQQLEKVAPGDTKVTIFSPVVGEVHRINEELRVVGRNFGTPADNTVFIDTTTQVTQFKLGSNDQLLVFDLPFVQNIPVNGRPVTLTVSNPRGFATTSFTLAQPVATLPTGTLTLTRTTSPAGNLAPGDHVFTYRVDAAATADEIYAVSATVDLGWRAQLVDGPNTRVPIVPSEIPIQRPEFPTVPRAVTFHIMVTIPATAQAGQTGNLRVRVASKRNPNNLARDAEPTALPFGGQAPPGDQIGINLASVFAPATIVNGAISLPAPTGGATSTQGFATFKVVVPAAGNYSVTTAFTGDPNGLWSATVLNGANGLFMQPPQADLQVRLNAGAGAPEATLTLRISADSNTTVTGDVDQTVRLG